LIRLADGDEDLVSAPLAKILVVDDNPINLNVALGLLRLYQITAETASSGRQAIELVRQNQYDIVFMDHMMPEMDGAEAAKIIRGMGINAPIIALTANAVTGARELLLAAGMDDFLPKPILKAALTHILKVWLPAEKLADRRLKTVVADEAEAEMAEKNRERQEFWNEIKQIDELSVRAGLSAVTGQRDVYEKSLKLMIKEVDKCDKNLDEFLSAGDMRGFSIEVHGMKSSLANIGATALSALARDLETAADQADASFCASNLPLFLERLKSLNFALKEAFAKKTRPRAPIEIPPELPIIFKRMTDALDEINFMALDEEIEKLDALNTSGALKEEIELLKDAVLIMDYDGAVETMQNIMDSKR
jgi:CheY-like chemotaxis protein/HPt (histidine-containing phosphotransfer) domain-containing protein